MSDNLYRVTPRQAREFIVDGLESGLVPFLRSSPGMGKSSIIKDVAKSFNLKVIDIRLSTCAPEDMSGLPEFYTDDCDQRRSRFVPFDLFPLEFNKLPEGYEGWMIFYDEANSGSKMVQAASYKVILDRMIGQSKLHDRVVQIAAGNLDSDRAITNSLSTAMQSRLAPHLEMAINHQEWMEDVALPNRYDDRIVAFLGFAERHLMDFRPDHEEKTFCCPRTWEFMNSLVQKPDGTPKPVTTGKTPLYAGTITSGVAAEFVAFCQLQNELLTIKDVLADPANAQLPQDAQRKWIITTHLVSKVTEKLFGDVCTYINRMDLSFRIQFFRSIMIQQPELRGHPDFAKAMSELSRYLSGK